MSNCVNRSSKEFKDCCKRLNVSSTTLEPIIHEFINIEGNENSFPSDVYIEERIHGSEQPVLSEEQVTLWEKRYSLPARFDDVLEALSYITKAERFFPRESIGLKETFDGKIEVRVTKPVYVGPNTSLEEFAREQERQEQEWEEVQQRNAIEEEKQQIKQKAIADGTFMKAPNGKPTNLTEDQWLSVRTKAFKDWFGDWEKGLHIKQDDKSYYRGQYEEPIIDKDGNLILMGKKDSLYERAGYNIEKGVSATTDMQLANEYGVNQRYAYEADVEEKYGEFDQSWEKEQELNEVAEHGYYLIQFPKNISNQIINETEEVKIVGNVVIPKGQYIIEYISDNGEEIITTTDNNASKVIDENGEPLVVYHGGQSNIEVFKNAKDNPDYKNTKHQGYTNKNRVGIYFSAYKDVAENYAGQYNKNSRKIYPTFLNIKNPYNVSYKDTLKNRLIRYGTLGIVNKPTVDNISDFELDTIYKGYDGVNHSNGTEFVVFNSNQIKSAEFNIGYSKEDDNIYHENEATNYTATRDARLEALRKQEEVSIVDLLNLIDSNSEYASIIDLLKTKKQRGKTPLLKGIKVKIVDSAITPESYDVKKLETSRGQYRRAYYDASSKRIIINSNGLFNGGRADSVILHEVIHAITVNRIKDNKKFRAEFDSIIEKYLEAFPHLKYRYGKDNNSHYMEEFIADIWSNTQTIEHLKSIKSDKKLTLWDRIKNFFVKLFAGSEGTLMVDASDALYRLLDELETDTSKDTFYEGEFGFKDGTVVKSPFIPNGQQVDALNAMSDFIDSDETHMTLSGYAGTGKTSLMEMLAEKVRKQHKHIVFSATTNKAAAVLKTKVGKIGFDAYTLNKVFGISVEVDSSKEYDAKNLVNVLRKSELVFPGSIVVIDEASMINEHNYKVLNEIAAAEDIKIIYVGDAAQLAPVNEHRISKVFRDNEGKVIELNKVERTADNAILKEATALRNGEELSGESSFNDWGEGVAYIPSSNRASVKEIIKEFIKRLKDNPDYFRILAYTNKAVNTYNRVVRSALGYTDAIPKIGEPMTGYANYGYNWRTGTYRLINSESYKVTEVQPSKTVSFTIGNNSYTLEIIPITLKDSLDKKESFDYVDIKNNPANLQVVKELAKEKSRLWNIARTASKEAKKIALQQINAIEEYLFVNDNVVEGERTLQAKVIDFGYALTIHKSQGSTFTHVLIDDVDVSTAKSQVDDPNTYALDLETGTIEKTTDIKSDGVNIQQQLRYVAVSRATNTVSIISDNVKSEDSPLNHISEGGQFKEVVTSVEQQPTTKEAVGDDISSNGISEFNLTSNTKLQEYQQSAEFYSGAADGADQAWAKYLREKDLKVKDFTVKDYDALPQSEKDRIEKDYQNIVQYLGRKAYSTNDYRGKLVRRDMLQAEAADAVFAIGTFDSKGWVSGGTAYAVTRAIGEKEVYFYDLNSLQWYIYEDQVGAFWPLNDIPTLTPHAAVIGTRDDVKITYVSKGPERLRKEGHDAIKAVIEKTFNENTETSEENLTQDEIDAKANKEAELDAIFQNTLQLTEQLKNIQDSGLISTSEFTQLANDVSYYISDLITSWQENPEEFKQSAPTLASEIDVRTLSRKELVEKIGVPKLLDVVKKALFGKRIPGVDARKTLLLFKNFDALIRFGSSAFNTVEDFQISYSEIGYTVSDKVESTENENLSNEENAVIEENGDKQEHWQIDSRTVDTFLTMSQAVKKELARCYNLNIDGSIKQNEFGINERMSPRDATSCILRWTQGSLTLSDMITKLEGKQENNPWIKPIIEKLRDNSGKYSDFQSQFFGVFCKHFQEYYIVKEFKDGNNRVLRIMPVNRTPALNEIMTSIEVLFKLKAHPMFDNKGLIEEKLNDLKSYVTLLNEISTGKFEELSLDRISKVIAKIADLLGYKTTDEMVILALTPESLYNIKKALSYIVSNLEKGLGDSNYNPFSFNKENKNGIRNNLKDFLQPLTEVLEDLAISSFFESGKMYQSYVIPSYMTKLMRKFQNSNEQEFKEFMQKEYSQYEWFRDQSRDIEDPNSWKNDWLRQLYFMSNENRKKLFGHKVQLSFVGHNYMRNMTGPEYVMAIMTEFFSGSKDSKETIVPTWYKIPMLSNKPSLEFIKFARYRGIGYEEAILDGLQQVFIQELGRIIEVKNRAYSDKDDRHIKNFDTNGQKFCFLDFLNSYLGEGINSNLKLGQLLNRKIESANKNSNIEKLTIEEENELFDLVRKEIDSFMTKKSNEIIQSYKDSGLFEAIKKIDGIGNTDAEIESNLRNFVWNDTYASMMILQMTITDVAYYANAEDLQKRLAQIHAPGIRPNVEAMDYGEYDEVGRLIRKAERVCDGNLRTVFLKDFKKGAVIQNVIENLEVIFSRKENESKTDAEKEYWRETKEAIIDAFKDINVTDAQAYNSITSYRKKAIMFGKWSPKNEEIYKKLKDGKWNISDLETIFQPLKPFVYTNSTKESVGSKLKVGMQFKNAEYALLIADAILRNEDTGKPNLLKVLSEIMEKSADRTPQRNKGIDTIMFDSAVKAGYHGGLDIANFKDEQAAKDYLESKIYGDGADGYNETYVHTFPAEDYSIQQDYSPHFLEHSQADGSQKRMIIPSDLNPNAEYQVNGIEKPFTAEEFKKEYEETYAENIENSLNELEFELGLNLPTKKLRNIALSQVLQKEILSSPRYGIDLYIACSVDSEGNFNIPLGDPIQSKRIEQLINSIVKNRLNKQKIKGGPVIQVSNFGSTRLNIKFKDKNGNILPTLTEWLEKNPGKTAKDFKTELENNQAGVAYYECYAPAYMQEMFEDFMDERGFIDWEAINELEPEMLEMIGFRIPTEDLYSIAPMKIMGFLPKEAGEVIMMPYEVTVVWGSDKHHCFYPTK